MLLQSLRHRLRRQLNRFRSGDGNVAVIFALALIPVVGAVGVAVDYSRASSARSAMHTALDSTALMLAKEVGSLRPDQIQQRAQDIFNSLYNRTEAFNVQIKLAYNSATGELSMSGTGVVKTSVANVLGIPEINISVLNKIVVAGSDLEIVLVLDNTGSMASSGKMQALIAASKMFIDELKKASKKPGDIKIGVVPFDTRVKVGSAYKAQPWFDWSGMTWTERNNWQGCVLDRDRPYDTNDTPPSGNPATWYPADKDACALPAILPLTSDFALATSKINEMKPNGYTNLTIGLVWGWHALSNGAPLTEAAVPSSKVAKYIIFLTDGENTRNRWTTNTSEIDRRTETVCDNIRAAGINVFTIRVKEGNEALLKRCATKPDMYYDVPAVSEVMKVFADIARNLSKLRIAQ